MRPRLSVVCMTANSGHRLEAWADLVRAYADELVVLVDQSSLDDTLAVATRVADRTAEFEHPPFIEQARDIGLRQATGEWILLLDDDEVMADGFVRRVPELLDDDYVTHYWLPYRWVVEGDGGSYGWLRTFPWHPNPRLRLFRNIGSIFADRGRLHAPIEVAGAGPVVADERAVMYHLDFVWRDRAAREAKVARYRNHPAPSCEEYYFWEDYQKTLDIAPVSDPAVMALARVGGAAGSGGARPDRESGRVLSAEMQRRSAARHWRSAEIFSAEYLGSTTPTEVLANRGYSVDLRLRNTSDLPWRTSGLADGRVVLGYHWVHPEYGTLLRDGDVALLPHEVEPGEEVTVPAGVWTPYDPGRYRLEWDLRAEGVNWFSERGVAPLSVEVDVADHDRLLGRPRAVAELPPRARGSAADRMPAGRPPPGPALASRLRTWRDAARGGWDAARGVWDAVRGAPVLAAANVVPVGPVRVLDTRNGTGFPGAPNGPIPAGDVVTMRVIGLAGIPDTAIGVVATLCVVDADYSGFVTAYQADGTAGTAHVSGFFEPARSSATQVVVRTGDGDHDGQISMHLSDHPGGSAQLLLDVFAYLA